jgi:hypothetical protein
MSSSNTSLKIFNKLANSLVNDYNAHLEANGIQVPDEIKNSFLVDKPSKRKGKLSPYTVFMKEVRSQFQKDHSEMSFDDVSKEIAKQWSIIKENPEKLQEYQEKAKKYNDDIPNKTKNICEAKKGSDKQPCKAEAKYGKYCGRHKKLAFDQVDVDEEASSANDSSSEVDYLSCKRDGCDKAAESGPFCRTCSKKEAKNKTCIKEKPNGQACGKKATKGEYCGFHDPNKKKKEKKIKTTSSKNEKQPEKIVSETQIMEESDGEISQQSIYSNPEIEETVMYYDECMNVYYHEIEDSDLILTKFLTYGDNIAYNDTSDEIGVIKDNKISLF